MTNTKPRATSDVSSLVSFVFALPLYGLLVVSAGAMPKDISRLLLERGWIPHVIMLLTCWSLAILLLKAVGLYQQRRAFAFQVLPADAQSITADSVPGVIEHVEALRTRTTSRRNRSFLFERVLRILEHYAARGDVNETATVNTADADADSASVASSFSMVKVLIWAIPILGFIGTVIGIGVAVGGFSQSIDGAEQLDTIKNSLGEVTSGLAVAFDTTLVALVASILVMLPTSWLQKGEERLVNDVDDYCVTTVLRRLASPQQRDARVPAEQLNPEDLRAVLVDSLAAPLADLLAANARLLERLAEDHEALRVSHHDLQEQLASFSKAATGLAPSVERATSQLDAGANHLAQATSELARAASQLQRTTHSAEQATSTMDSTQGQLCRELGASRQLLQLLAAGMGDAPARPQARPSNGANGSNGSSLRE